MDPSNPRDAADRGRRDRRDGKRTQDNRSRSRPSRNEAVPDKYGPQNRPNLKPAKRESSRRRKVLDEAHLTGTPGVAPIGQYERLVMAHKETKAELPRLLSQVNMGGGVSAQMLATQHKVYTPRTLKQPDPALCPGLPPVVIRVTREDTLTAAIRLAQEANAAATAAASDAAAAKAAGASSTAKKRKLEDDDRSSVSLSVSTSSTSSEPKMPPYPLIINFANRDVPGGGWSHGAMAQEEALFYRSSLSLSLDPKIYPLAHNSIVYSPCVFVIREELAAGHKLLKPETFPVVSAVTVAALQRPRVRTVQVLKRSQAEMAEMAETPSPPTKKAALPVRQMALRSHAQSSRNKAAKAAASPLLPSMRPSRRMQGAAASDTFFSLGKRPQPSPGMLISGAVNASAMLEDPSPFVPINATALLSPRKPPPPNPDMANLSADVVSAMLKNPLYFKSTAASVLPSPTKPPRPSPKKIPASAAIAKNSSPFVPTTAAALPSLPMSPGPSPEMFAASIAIASAMLTDSATPVVPAAATPLPSPPMQPSDETIAASIAIASAGLAASQTTEPFDWNPTKLFESRPTEPSSLRPTKLHAPSPAAAPRSQRLTFADKVDRNITKTKMRLVLRAAAAHGHQQLVLGALGCGVFGNPPEDVARCWLEVLREEEFVVKDPSSGELKSWWKDVVFAVFDTPKRPVGKWVKPYAIDGDGDDGEDDPNDNSNYGIFKRVLDGKSI